MKELSFEEIKQIQLEILSDVHAFCEEHGLRYALWGGTLLGAVRHNGYIPWDDDIDICMPREDYETFCETFRRGTKVAKNCRMDPAYPYVFAKAYDSTTKKQEDVYGKESIDLGIDIDIFAIDEVRAKKEGVFCFSKGQLFRRRFRCLKWIGSVQKRSAGGNHRFIKSLSALFLNGKSNKLANKINAAAKAFAKDPVRVGQMLYCDTNIKVPVYLEEDLFAERVLHPFEDRSFYIPKCYDKLLTLCYGDYMTPPPVEKRDTHHAFTAYRKDMEA